jgi:large conductance mechanosensitive channel
MFKGFRDFVMRGNVVDLAVAVIIGGAFNQVVNALVKNLITPVIGALGGTPDFSKLNFVLNGSKILVGDFLNAVISFLIVASVVYFFIVTPMNRIMAKIKKGEKVDPTEKNCPFCYSSVPIKATRCKFCTSNLK